MGDPTPEEILERRAEIHRLRGEHKEADGILERGVEYANLIPEEKEGDPRFKTIYELGLPTRIAVPLERAGVMFAGELQMYTRERLRLFREFADGSIRTIEKALADIGLRLREQSPREKPAPIPQPIAEPRRPNRTPKLTDRQVDRMFELTALGTSQRITARLMSICRWTVWNRMRVFKAAVRSLYGMGATDRQVRKKLGENRWEVWQRYSRWGGREKAGAA